MAEELTTDVQQEHVAFENNCNLRKSNISLEEDSDVSLRGILDTAFTSTVDSQDNGAFERCRYFLYLKTGWFVGFILHDNNFKTDNLIAEMANDGLFSENEVDSVSRLFHPGTSFGETGSAGTSYSSSDSSFHESYFLDHSYISGVSTSSVNKRKRCVLYNFV